MPCLGRSTRTLARSTISFRRPSLQSASTRWRWRYALSVLGTYRFSNSCVAHAERSRARPSHNTRVFASSAHSLRVCRAQRNFSRSRPGRIFSCALQGAALIHVFITTLIGGHIDMVFNPDSQSLAHFRAQAESAGVTSEARWPDAADTPTYAGVRRRTVFPGIWFWPVGAESSTPATIVRPASTMPSTWKPQVRGGARSLARARHRGQEPGTRRFCAALSEQCAHWKGRRRRHRIKIE